MENQILEFKEVMNGEWSSAGNFLGKCLDGDTVHIYEKQMEHLGYQRTITDPAKFTDKVKPPLFVLTYRKQFLNRNNEQVIRLTAASVWKSYKDLIDALLCDHNLEAAAEIEFARRLNEINEKTGLSLE